MKLLVQVRQVEDGYPIFEQEVDVENLGLGSNFATAAENGYIEDTPVNRALWTVAPEVCPWDCSYCRE